MKSKNTISEKNEKSTKFQFFVSKNYANGSFSFSAFICCVCLFPSSICIASLFSRASFTCGIRRMTAASYFSESFCCLLISFLLSHNLASNPSIFACSCSAFVVTDSSVFRANSSDDSQSLMPSRAIL